MFFGTYRHNLDDKNRLVVPSKFRNILGSSSLYIMQGYEGALEVYKQETFAALVSRIEKLAYNDPNARNFIRTRLSSVVEVEVDNSGRISLPVSLVNRYNITKDVVVIGVNDHFEIWSASKWDPYIEEVGGDLENIAARLGNYDDH